MVTTVFKLLKKSLVELALLALEAVHLAQAFVLTCDVGQVFFPAQKNYREVSTTYHWMVDGRAKTS